jgi:hypothetical protein
VTPIESDEGFYGWILKSTIPQFISDFMSPEEWEKQGFIYSENYPLNYKRFRKTMIRDLMSIN